MDKERHHMDDFFNEGLKNLKISPPEEVWKEIENRLNKRRSVIIVKFLIGLAAGLALLIGVGTYYFTVSKTPNPKTPTAVAVTKLTKKEVKPRHVNPGNASVAIVDSPKRQNKYPKESHTSLSAHTTPVYPVHTLSSVTNTKHPAWNNTKDSVNTKKTGSPYVALSENLPELSGNYSSVPKDTEAIPVYVHPREINLKIEKSPGLVNNSTNTEITKKISDSDSLNNAIVAKNLLAMETSDLPANAAGERWSIEGQIAPLFSNRRTNEQDAAGGNGINYNSMEKGLVAYAGGVKVNYKTSSRLSFQTGIYYSVLGQVLPNVTSESYGANALNINNNSINSITEASSNSIGPISNKTNKVLTINPTTRTQDGKQASAALYSFNAADARSGVEEGKIVRQFNFIEIPFFLRYKIIDRKMGFHLVGGFSTNFLVDNSATFVAGNYKEVIGKNEGINVVNYSSSIGFGINYKFIRKVDFTIEPTYKYYLNSFSTNKQKNVHPYAFGIFTGFTYLF